MYLRTPTLLLVEYSKPSLPEELKEDSSFPLKEGKQLVEQLNLNKRSLPNKGNPNQDRAKL